PGGGRGRCRDLAVRGRRRGDPGPAGRPGTGPGAAPRRPQTPGQHGRGVAGPFGAAPARAPAHHPAQWRCRRPAPGSFSLNTGASGTAPPTGSTTVIEIRPQAPTWEPSASRGSAICRYLGQAPDWRKGTQSMNMLYDSEAFAVVHILANAPAEGETPTTEG